MVSDKADTLLQYNGRRRLLCVLLIGSMAMLIGRAIDIQVLDRQFLQDKGRLQSISEIPVAAYRGRIVDRNGEPLAISTPVKNVWINPQKFSVTPKQSRILANLLGVSNKRLSRLSDPSSGKQFVFLKRRIDPPLARKVRNLELDGLYFTPEYRRYYPSGEVSAHLVGFTNIDDEGQEGVELSYDARLRGVIGSQKILRDGRRRIIENVAKIRSPVPGQDLVLSIDQRLQYLAYRELKAAVQKHKARSGSIIMLDAQTGEIMAMANQPSFNPNTRKNLKGFRYRNRAVTDLIEPGSTIKPFTVGCALEYGNYKEDSIIDTRPGMFRVGRNLVRDIHNYGVIDVARVLQKSSNVGASKIGLSLPSETLWSCIDRLGFGRITGIGFPGEVSGRLPHYADWRRFEQATISFGYGISGTALQLVRAYLVLANGGQMPAVSLILGDTDYDETRVMSVATAASVSKMLEKVVNREGTALKASIPGFRVAGKTGTVKKLGANGYSRDRYIALFVGMAPASRPKFVTVVVIDEPSAGDYYGGVVAAPVFSQVMGAALRLTGAVPDSEEIMPLVLARRGGGTT